MTVRVEESTECLPTVPRHVARQLGHYVYLYVDPRNGKPFYVGKGLHRRCLAHLSAEVETRKGRILQAIRRVGKEPRIDILAHGLPDKETALRIEAAVIALLNLDGLGNKVRGWRSVELGRWPLADLVAHYAAKPIKIDDPVMLIRINKRYTPGMPDEELYEATRSAWRVGRRRANARFACAIFEGVVREIYEIREWHQSLLHEGRWEFVGKIADESVRSKYLGRRVDSYFTRGSQNPVIYVNCHGAKPAAIDGRATVIGDPVILVRINKLHRPGMSSAELYEATQRAWRVGRRREGARFACAVFEGVVRDVYEISQWRHASPREGEAWKGDRWEFVGKIASESVRSKYLGRPVSSHFIRGAQNPITYVNC